LVVHFHCAFLIDAIGYSNTLIDGGDRRHQTCILLQPDWAARPSQKDRLCLFALSFGAAGILPTTAFVKTPVLATSPSQCEAVPDNPDPPLAGALDSGMPRTSQNASANAVPQRTA